jgi:hypothetical protein
MRGLLRRAVFGAGLLAMTLASEPAMSQRSWQGVQEPQVTLEQRAHATPKYDPIQFLLPTRSDLHTEGYTIAFVPNERWNKGLPIGVRREGQFSKSMPIALGRDDARYNGDIERRFDAYALFKTPSGAGTEVFGVTRSGVYLLSEALNWKNNRQSRDFYFNGTRTETSWGAPSALWARRPTRSGSAIASGQGESLVTYDCEGILPVNETWYEAPSMTTFYGPYDLSKPADVKAAAAHLGPYGLDEPAMPDAWRTLHAALDARGRTEITITEGFWGVDDNAGNPVWMFRERYIDARAVTRRDTIVPLGRVGWEPSERVDEAGNLDPSRDFTSVRLSAHTRVVVEPRGQWLEPVLPCTFGGPVGPIKAQESYDPAAIGRALRLVGTIYTHAQ